MAPRWFRKIDAKLRSTRPSSPLKPALPSTTPSQSASSGPETSSRSLQERLWNQAYDELKANESDIVEAYEKILSGELHRGDSASTGCASEKNEIEQVGERRWCQMKQLVQAGLERTQREAAIKQGIGDGLQAISAVRGIVDKAVQAAPEAAVAWVGVCLGLEILSNPITEAGINRRGIAYVLSRMNWYWNLVCLLLDENRAEGSSAGLRDELQSHIVQLYQKLLLYQMKSVCLYHRNRAAIVLRDMFKLDDWAGQLNEIQEDEAAIQKDSEQYNTEQVKSHLQDLAITARSQEMKLQDIHSAIQDQTRQQEKRHQDDRDKQCLKDLHETDPRDDKKRIQDTKGGLLRDSYRWILDHADFQQWRDDPQSRLLWIKGDPGKGKTMLLCGIIDELEKESANRLSYFFCQATEAQLSNATAVLRGLIYLLIIQQPSLISHVRVKYDVVGDKLFENINAWVSLTEILTDMLRDPTLEDAVLVVDALDECRINLPQLLDFIARASSSSRAKWIVSSRNWPNIEERLNKTTRKVKLSLELNEDSISGAVHLYIRHAVNQLAYDKAYDDGTRNAVERHLTSNANNTFLWVALVCQELRNVSETWDVLDVVEEMPAGLEDLYDRMMQQIQKLGRRNPEMCRAILSTVTTAYRPLHLEELGHLSGLPSNIPRTKDCISKIASMCGSFLTIRDHVVYIIHQSAKDFLSSNMYLFHSGMRDEHHAIFSRSLEVLSSTLRRDIYSLGAPGLPTDQISPPDPDPMASTRYSCIYWVDHLGDSDSAKRMREKDLQDGGVVHAFLKKKYLYWLEALSLLRSMSEGVMALQKLEALVRHMGAPQLTELLRDARRFILFHKRAIEVTPLQSYASALVFSPARSLVRELFKKEEPDWITLKPSMEANWNACLQTLEGHDVCVNSVAFSADGQQVASGSGDKTVKIWDAATGACVQTLKGHNDWVNSVAFSADGQQVASGSGDKTVKIWDAATDACVRTLEGHDDSVNSVAFSADGQRIISGSGDKTVKIWNAATGICVRTLEGHDDWVNSVAFSADGQRIVSGSSDKTVKIWDAATGACVQTLEGHGNWVYSVAFSASGQQVVSGSGDKTVRVWDIATGTSMQTLEGHGHSVRSLAFSVSGQRIVSGSSDKTVRVWDAATGACVQTLEGHDYGVSSVAFSVDSQRIISGSNDKTVKIWDAATGACVQTLEGHGNWVGSVAFSADGQQVVSGSGDRTVKVWDAATGACVQTLEGHNDSVNSVAFSANSQRLASGSSDKTVKIWDAATGACVQTLEGHDDWVNSVALSADGQRLASGSSDKTMKVWDIASGTCVQTLNIGRSIIHLSFDPMNNSRLSTGISVLNLDLSSVTDTQLTEASLRDASNYRYGVSIDGIWVVKDGQRMLWLPPDYRTPIAVVGSTVAIGCHSSRVLVMEF